MTRTRIIGFIGLGACVLGYGGFAAALVLARMEILSTPEALMLGAPSAVIGEIGLWVAAVSLGWSLFRGRRAMFDRLFRRGARTV